MYLGGQRDTGTGNRDTQEWLGVGWFGRDGGPDSSKGGAWTEFFHYNFD